MLSFDYTNMLAESVGTEHGITEAEISELADRTRTAHDDIVARRDRGELPFFDLPSDVWLVAEVQALAAQIRDRFDHVVVLGIGGSALGTTAVFNALCPSTHNLMGREERGGAPRLFVLDNVDPDSFAEILSFLAPEKTCFLVISKSGSTVETSCQFLVARQWVEKRVGETFREHFVLITDPDKGALRQLARDEGYRSCPIPSGVGGRFSVFTAVGLLPLACVGVDIDGLLAGARSLEPSVCQPNLLTNPAYLNAALQYLAYQKGKHISVLMPYSDRLKDVADWFRQLWAESLGKKYGVDGTVLNVGPTPVNALGTTDQHSQVQLYVEGPFDKVVTFLTVEQYSSDLAMATCPGCPSLDYLDGHSMGELIDMERQATAAALTKNSRLNASLSIPSVSPESLGALIYLFEVQTLFAGYLFGVDPLDQPGVEEGKNFTYALMGRPGYDEKAAEFTRLTTRCAPRKLTVD